MSAAQGSYELVLCGSPRKNGVSSRYAAQLTAELEAKGVVIEHWNVADHAVSGCIGCEGCRRALQCVECSGHLAHCVIRDDMDGLYALLDGAAAVHVVAPVYFSGPTARSRPFWTDFSHTGRNGVGRIGSRVLPMRQSVPLPCT